MKFIAYYLLFTIATFLLMAIFELPDKVFGGAFFLVLIFFVYVLIKKLKLKKR